MCFRNFISVPIKSRVPLGVFSCAGAARVANSVVLEESSISSEYM